LDTTPLSLDHRSPLLFTYLGHCHNNSVAITFFDKLYADSARGMRYSGRYGVYLSTVIGDYI
jgi:hypothetical protein